MYLPDDLDVDECDHTRFVTERFTLDATLKELLRGLAEHPHIIVHHRMIDGEYEHEHRTMRAVGTSGLPDNMMAFMIIPERFLDLSLPRIGDDRLITSSLRGRSPREILACFDPCPALRTMCRYLI